MNHSKNFEKVKKYWLSGLWDESRVRNAVIKEWISEAEYAQITGHDYAS